MMAENAEHNRRSIDEKQTTGGARMIAIIDYDAGNIKSVEKALHYLGEETVVSRDPQVLLSADKVILPGVGSFGDAMNNLNKFGLVPVIKEITEKRLGKKLKVFAYPYGHKRKEVVEMVKECGYSFAVSTDTGSGIFTKDLFDIRRTAIDKTSLINFLRRISPRYLQYKARKYKDKF